MGHRHVIRPVNILDPDEQALLRRDFLHELGHAVAFSAVACGVLHRVVQAARFGGLRQFEQVMQKNRVVCFNQTVCERLLRTD